MTILALALAALVALAPPAAAAPLQLDVPGALTAVEQSGGRYQRGAASLAAADCSGLVSVAQSIATGQPPRRLGNTTSLLAGRWPHAIPGASEADVFVIGSSSGHMVARVNGVGIEARQSGEPYRIGDDAASPWSLPTQWHVDPAVLR